VFTSDAPSSIFGRRHDKPQDKIVPDVCRSDDSIFLQRIPVCASEEEESICSPLDNGDVLADATTCDEQVIVFDICRSNDAVYHECPFIKETCNNPVDDGDDDSNASANSSGGNDVNASAAGSSKSFQDLQESSESEGAGSVDGIHRTG
jgi:hypothetical protein